MTKTGRATSPIKPYACYRLMSSNSDAEVPSRDLVGSKAHNLMVMARAGLPVPPGFVLTTDLCRAYMEKGAIALSGLESVLAYELDALGQQAGRCFGDPKRPLLLSVRSGAAVSMPGMMETVLNVGLNETTMAGLVRLTGNPRLALDCERRLLEQYGEVVHGLDARMFTAILDGEIAAAGVAGRQDLDTVSLRSVVQAYRAVYELKLGHSLPEQPITQLMTTIEAVLKSWMSERAMSYRTLNGISHAAGTATLIQMMVFGNAGPTSGSGVGFSRNPSDGTDALYIDYLPNSQGEDVVAGRRNALGADALEHRAPDAYRRLVENKALLERTFHDMQDFEFTIERGQLFMLQARSGKRTPLAALRIAHDLVASGLITPESALARLPAGDLDSIECQELAPPPGLEPVARATPASTGVVVGAVVVDPARVGEMRKSGKKVILLREHAETADIDAVAQADALITARGARTSHAAVVARQLGKVCLVACDTLQIDGSGRSCRLGETVLQEGDVISVDGSSGLIYVGALEVRRTTPKTLLAEIKKWRRKRSVPRTEIILH